MLNFENSIRMDKIASMPASELAKIQELLAPTENKTALQQVKDMLVDGKLLCDIPSHILINAIEIKMNTVGYYHHGIDGTCYDLWQLAEQLMDYYAHDKLKHDIANVLYDADYYGYGDDE